MRMRRASKIPRRRNKYNNTRTKEYASTKEQQRHGELLLLERAGKIRDLKRQVVFEVIPAQREPDTKGPRGGVKKGKTIELAVKYVADFTYFNTATGEYVVEDVKGYRKEAAYKIYVIKRKLMLYRYGIRIKEV